MEPVHREADDPRARGIELRNELLSEGRLPGARAAYDAEDRTAVLSERSGPTCELLKHSPMGGWRAASRGTVAHAARALPRRSTCRARWRGCMATPAPGLLTRTAARAPVRPSQLPSGTRLRGSVSPVSRRGHGRPWARTACQLPACGKYLAEGKWLRGRNVHPNCLRPRPRACRSCSRARGPPVRPFGPPFSFATETPSSAAPSILSLYQ